MAAVKGIFDKLTGGGKNFGEANRQRMLWQGRAAAKRTEARVDALEKNQQTLQSAAGGEDQKVAEKQMSREEKSAMVNPLNVGEITVTQVIAGNSKQDILFAQKTSEKNTKYLKEIASASKNIDKNTKVIVKQDTKIKKEEKVAKTKTLKDAYAGSKQMMKTAAETPSTIWNMVTEAFKAWGARLALAIPFLFAKGAAVALGAYEIGVAIFGAFGFSRAEVKDGLSKSLKWLVETDITEKWADTKAFLTDPEVYKAIGKATKDTFNETISYWADPKNRDDAFQNFVDMIGVRDWWDKTSDQWKYTDKISAQKRKLEMELTMAEFNDGSRIQAARIKLFKLVDGYHKKFKVRYYSTISGAEVAWYKGQEKGMIDYKKANMTPEEKKAAADKNLQGNVAAAKTAQSKRIKSLANQIDGQLAVLANATPEQRKGLMKAIQFSQKAYRKLSGSTYKEGIKESTYGPGSNISYSIKGSGTAATAAFMGVDKNGVPLGAAVQGVKPAIWGGMSIDNGFRKIIDEFETGGKASYKASAGSRSSAYGRYQFTIDTAKEVAAKEGIDFNEWKKPENQDRMFQRFTNDNIKRLKSKGIDVNVWTLWLAHNLGAGSVRYMTGMVAKPWANRAKGDIENQLSKSYATVDLSRNAYIDKFLPRIRKTLGSATQTSSGTAAVSIGKYGTTANGTSYQPPAAGHGATGSGGYGVAQTYSRSTSSAATMGNLADYAQQFVGRQYSQQARGISGGVVLASSDSYDCSSLAALIAQDLYGIPMNKFGSNTKAQWPYLIKKINADRIKRSEIKGGEFLMFKNDETIISHIAFAVDNKRMLHARGKDLGVAISNIDDSDNLKGVFRIASTNPDKGTFKGSSDFTPKTVQAQQAVNEIIKNKKNVVTASQNIPGNTLSGETTPAGKANEALGKMDSRISAQESKTSSQAAAAAKKSPDATAVADFVVLSATAQQ